MGMFDQIKQAMQMRKEAARIKAEVEKITFTYENGGIACDVRGDMSVTAIRIQDEAFKEVLAGKPERFNTMLTNVVNGALKGVQKKTQEAMMKMMQANGGLAGLGM